MRLDRMQGAAIARTAAAAIALLCSAEAGAAGRSGATFTPPRAWMEMSQAQIGRTGDPSTIGVWIRTSASRKAAFPENIRLRRSASPNAAIDAFVRTNVANLKRWDPASVVGTASPNPRCPRSSEILSYSSSRLGTAIDAEVVATMSGTTGYTATYSRAASSKADRAAMKSIRTLCPA